MSEQLKQEVENLIQNNDITVFMKGNLGAPVCGFSAQVDAIFAELNKTYKDINILEREDLRQYMKEYSDWPTFPQVYVAGEFLGGCDIIIDMFQSGELAKYLEENVKS